MFFFDIFLFDIFLAYIFRQSGVNHADSTGDTQEKQARSYELEFR
jgi:hypothetical protein